VRFSGLIHALLLSSTLLGAAACKKPAPPTIVPKEARAVGISPSGLDLVIVVEATNPNAITLSAQSVTATAKLDGTWDVGTVTITKPFALPPNAPTRLDVPLTIPWTDVRALGALALAQKPVSYVVEGTVGIGGDHLSVDLPFSVTGTITREQIAAAALKSIPSLPLLPGQKLAPP
jgi:LEA14-like dessication related protein